MTLAITTVSPTRSCDHLSCFWLGKVVSKRQKHNSKRRQIQGSRFSQAGFEVEKNKANTKKRAPTRSLSVR
jgi:hypothetical protein